MKSFTKKMLGVTLLEILLVLAIAAMIIVMSVRYYQSSTASQQANSALEQIQAITAAADGMAQASGTYTGVSYNSVRLLMPNKVMTTSWGGSISIDGQTNTSYDVTLGETPPAVCQMLLSKMQANTQYNITTTNCDSAGDFKYTYRSNT